MIDIVHIGYHKTGTNWFQRHLYPFVRGHEYIRRPLVRQAFLDLGAFEFDPSVARDRLQQPAGASVILCEEELSGNIHTGGLAGCLSKDMALRIHRVFPDATIVIFIRNQVSMIASVYKQYIREGGTHSVNRYLAPRKYLHNSGFRQAKAPYFTFDHFEYLPLIKWYREIFGANQVKVFAFEDFQLDSTAFSHRYCQTLGLQVEWDRVTYESVNDSYCSATMAIARVINRFTYRDVADKRLLFNVPGLYRGRGKVLRAFNNTALAGRTLSATSLLGDKWVSYINDRYGEFNRLIMEELGLPLDKLGYPLGGK